MATIHPGPAANPETASREEHSVSVNTRPDSAGAAVDRLPDSAAAGAPRGVARVRSRRRGASRRIDVAVIGATGYAGGEAVRLLAQHPNVRITGLVGRGREHEPVGHIHPHLASTMLEVDAATPASDAVFLALPHGAAAALVPDLIAEGRTVIDLGPDFRLRNPADYPRWYHFEHPTPDLLAQAVYGLPELHRAELSALADADTVIVGAPGCYPTATILALAPLAREGLIGDLVVDAKSGVSGAGREAKADLNYSEVNESIKAYGITNHRHVAEMEQELGALDAERAAGRTPANPGTVAIDFLPHLVPMTRGILSACYVRPTRSVSQADLVELYEAAYADEPFVHLASAPPTTKSVTGSNLCRIHVRLDERTGRILAIGVIDNLVKGAAGQAVQAFNLAHGLDELAGLGQLPIAP
jgi:N-acetyl-gamma-glutamyl-phosphate reductase